MIVLVRFDLEQADLDLFEDYERQVLALLPRHGARLTGRWRSLDDRQETHLLAFPGPEALDAFRADPERQALQGLWQDCGAISQLEEVRDIA